MTDRDEEFQAEIDAAVAELARRLRMVSPLKDPEAAARDFIEGWQLPHHWRVIPKPQSWRDLHDQRPADPNDNPEWREAKAKITGKDPT